MPKAPPPVRVGRRQADPPPTPDAPARAKTGPRALPLAVLVPIDQIEPDPDQPRKDHGAESLTALANSLTEYGVLQPLLVRDAGERDDGRTRYIIIAGGRRYAAALLAGLPRLPVVIKNTSGAALRMTQLVENIQRQDLAPLEEGRAFQELMDADGLTAAALASRLHISPQKVSDRLLVLADQTMADAVQRGQITPTVARDVLRMAPASQAPLRARIDAGARVDGAAIQEAREDALAAGIVNPRSKGGGRAARRRPAQEAGSPPQEHTPYVPAPPVTTVASPAPRPVAPLSSSARGADAHYQRALGRVDGPALEAVLLHGIERGWSCQELLRAIREGRASGDADRAND